MQMKNNLHRVKDMDCQAPYLTYEDLYSYYIDSIIGGINSNNERFLIGFKPDGQIYKMS